MTLKMERINVFLYLENQCAGKQMVYTNFKGITTSTDCVEATKGHITGSDILGLSPKHLNIKSQFSMKFKLSYVH